MLFCPCTLDYEHLDQDAWLIPGICLMLDGNVNDLPNDAVRNSFLRNKLDHLPSFPPNPWIWHGNDLLHCPALQTLLWNMLHTFNSFLRHSWNFNDLFSDALDTRISVGQLALVVSDRIPVARELMSQNLGLVLRLATTLDAVRRLAVVLTLLLLEQGHHLIDHRDDLREIGTLAAESLGDQLQVGRGLLRILEPRSSSITRLFTAGSL